MYQLSKCRSFAAGGLIMIAEPIVVVSDRPVLELS